MAQCHISGIGHPPRVLALLDFSAESGLETHRDPFGEISSGIPTPEKSEHRFHR
jgi:hypothetical protein